jgi:7-cyano-7-deazaguanine reductase
MTKDRVEGLTILGKSVSACPDRPERTTLESFANKYSSRDYLVQFNCPEFTSLCPVTGQPDFARIKISYIPDKRCLESKSLKLYLGSFRNHGMFHEEVANRILEDIVAAVEPRWALVRGLMNRRGGISIEVSADFLRNGCERTLDVLKRHGQRL